MSETKSRFTIGVLVSGIMDEYTRYICDGVLQKARATDVDVVFFPGKYLDRDLSDNRELMYEYQYNTLFSYAGAKTVDAVIIAAGSISCFTTQERMERMIKQYAGIPCVLLSSKVDGYASVAFDNYYGIKEAMEYLIEKKGCKHFGMVGGGNDNSDAYERKKAFISILESHGIAFKEKMFVAGDLSRRSTEVHRKILDDNPEIEAIFCVNDDTAIGMYEEMNRRGLRPGKDIYVFGYDDTIVAAKASPTLSSVRADASRLGEEALKMVIAMLKGEQVESRVIPTQLVRRDSTGQEDDAGEMVQYSNQNYEQGFEKIFYRYCREEMKETMDVLRAAYRKAVALLVENAESGFSDMSCYTDLMLSVDEFLNRGAVEYADVDLLLNGLEKLYRTLRMKQPEEKGKIELRDVFFNIYRKTIRSMNGIMGKMEEKQARESYEMKLFVQGMLQFEKGKDQSYGVLLENLDWLGIKNAKIYTLPEPILHLYKEDFTPPDVLLLKAVLKDGNVKTVSAIHQKKKLENIFRQPQKDRKKQVLLPLFFNEMLYGVMLCDMTESLYTNGELLVNQASSAVKMISLLEANEKIQTQLEENMAVLKEHNIELDTISKSDVLTGVLNRRGFYDVAEALFEENCEKKKQMLAIYVDMNNLKIINDRYGHEEGDFSLKRIGEFLKEMVGDKGAAGRIGGDEYACLMEYAGKEEGREVLAALYERFEKFNEHSDKPYNITVSAGAFPVSGEDCMTLHEALLQADERLYEVKQHRKKDVAKND